MEIGPNLGCSLTIHWMIDNAIHGYKEMYEKAKEEKCASKLLFL